VLHMHRLPDLVLDAAPSVRQRLLDELQLAVGTVAAMWGGEDFGESLRIHQEASPVLQLLDEERSCAGTLAFIDANLFLLVPFAPRSLFLAGGDTFFFGLLDAHQIASQVGARGIGSYWRWQTYFFMLKSGTGEARRLLWCRHPGDERCSGELQVSRIRTVQPLDTPQGEPCLIIDAAASTAEGTVLTLRAASLQSREDWIVSIRTMMSSS